jgi:Tfp pilus assembly protein PilF
MNPARSQAEALFFAGNRQRDAGETAAAAASFRQALALCPDFAEAHANLALLLEQAGDSHAAEAAYRRSLELDAGIAATHLNLGAMLLRQKRLTEAESELLQAVRLDPESAVSWTDFGVLHACLQRDGEAEDCYRMALLLDGEHAAARFNLSYLLLRQGRFDEGWRCLEARDWYRPLARRLDGLRWQGEALAGKSLLICYEAGHGDVIQFIRYAALLKAQGAAQLTLICHPPLKALLSGQLGLDRVLDYDEPLPAGWDWWTPLLSLPYLCRTRLDSIPAALPYLQAPPALLSRWQNQLPADGLRVGLVWKGSVGFENDADRSLPSLEVLLPLGSVAGVRWISLQKGAGEDEAAQPPAALPLLNLGSRVGSFADTAAIVAGLDLVIAVDTAVAHLAGALGKPCWLLLPAYKTDWRWLTGRSDSPWYPGVMRLFRQPEMGAWAAVIEDVRQALQEWVARQTAG